MSEDLFIKQINQKDARAFHIFFSNFYSSLVAFAMEYIHEQQICEDIVQEFFIQLWESNHTFPSQNHLKNFAYTTVRHNCLNYIKHQSVEKKYVSYYLQHPENTDDIDLKIAKEELYRILFSIIKELPMRRQEIFKLYMQGNSNIQISQLLDIDTETVKSAKAEAMRYIRKRIEEILIVYIIILVKSSCIYIF